MNANTNADTKVRLYMIYILPVLLYGCETWTITKTISKRLDAFDTVLTENSTDTIFQEHYKRNSSRCYCVYTSL